MSENEGNDPNSWRTNQHWIKDVLSKSGTELMEIPSSAKMERKGSSTAKKVARKTNAKASQNKMVYYQSTPLIVKTEQPSQAQFCMPLPKTTATTTAPNVQQQTPHPQSIPQNSSVNKNESINVTYHHHLLPSPPPQSLQSLSATTTSTTTTTSINNTQVQLQQQQTFNHASNPNYLTTNIKQELLLPPPSSSIPYYVAQATPPTALTLLTRNGEATTTTPIPTPAARKSATNKPQFKCEQCGMFFGSKSAHTSHSKSHTKSNGLSATTSTSLAGDGPSTSAAAAARLMQVAVNEVGGEASILPKVASSLNKQLLNGVASAGSDPYQCEVCQKTFAVPARLVRHFRTHTGERPFKCEFCHKLFSVKENLQVHRRIHTKERPYKCDVCGRAFEHSGKLHRHMRIHTGERPHKCSVCEKTFIQSGQLVIHLRTHTGEKPYRCPVEGCGKGFTCSKQLKVHSRTHTGEKPYRCDICQREFGYNHVLKLHRMQHYGSKCYKCTICEDTFKSKKEMETHIKGHANDFQDGEEETVSGRCSKQTSASSSSSGSSSADTSGPCSPQSPPTTSAAAVKAVRKVKPQPTRPLSSPSSTLSPNSFMMSTTRPSISSPSSPNTLSSSSAVSVKLETVVHTRDSDLNSISQKRQLPTSTLTQLNAGNTGVYNVEEMPTDLSIQHHQSSKYYQPTTLNNSMYQEQTALYTYMHHSPVPPAQSANCETPTINPALLEAATIASRRVMLEPHEEDVTAALQIMQLQRSQQHHHLHHRQQEQQQQQQPTYQPMQNSQATVSSVSVSNTSSASPATVLVNDLFSDDTREANELIEHYKRGELARHGIHKAYAAPVPRFESSLTNNEIILRTVEAAIAPLRSSTESPDRSSSPESDSMMMADRDVMTLPLRKRKMYMSQEANDTAGGGEHAPNSNGTINNATGAGTKAVRMNSVIQFAKAS